MNSRSVVYERISVVKILIEAPSGRILLIQEPRMNEWMPGRWGLPGGRPVEKESIKEAVARKLVEEIGRDMPIDGLYKIEELLIDGRTVLMFVVVAHASEEFAPGGTSLAYKWADLAEIHSMKIEEFTEYYSKELFGSYLTGEKVLVPLDIFDTHTYYLFSGESEYQRWWNTSKNAK
jgi:ADP-ribose pyrophosphatase YjhB (NUDIX family)